MDSKDPSSAPQYSPPPYSPPPYSAPPYPTPCGTNVPSQSGLNFIDFLPAVLARAKLCAMPVYEPFRGCVERANRWLQENREWKIITCESIELVCRGYYADSSKMTWVTDHEHGNFYVRGIRLFLRERTNLSEGVQQIGYLNLCPQKCESGNIFSFGKYEPLDVLVQKYNTYMRGSTNPAFQGRILTIETQQMLKSCDFVPDKSNWVERGERNHFVFILRIFYEVMPLEPEEIGIQDFTPYQLSQGGIFSCPEYEPFGNVISRASAWCSQQRDIRICNVQSIEMKVKRDGVLHTQKTDFVESNVGATYFARILRVAYTKSPYSSYGITNISCKTFIPLQISAGCVPTYENLYQTKERVSAWVKATGARVISAETSKFRLRNRNRMQTPQDSFALSPSDKNEYWIHVISLYLDGVYMEPPPEMLPPIPIVNTQCCTLL